jgi:hypothetical protein
MENLKEVEGKIWKRRNNHHGRVDGQSGRVGGMKEV